MATYMGCLVVVAFLVYAIYEHHHLKFGAGRHSKERFSHGTKHQDNILW